MITVSPSLFLMVVWRQVTSCTTPVFEPTLMLSPGPMMRISETCMPPMRFESVSWKPSESAMPPTPRAASTAVMFTPKQVSNTKLMPKPHTMMRTMLMKMEPDGMELSSRRMMWRSQRTSKCEQTATHTKISTAMTMRPSRSPPVVF